VESKYFKTFKKNVGQVGTALLYRRTVVVMDVLYLNKMINHCIRKMILIGYRSPNNIIFFYSLVYNNVINKTLEIKPHF